MSRDLLQRSRSGAVGRRPALRQLVALAAGAALAQPTRAGPAAHPPATARAPRQRLAAAWRLPDGSGGELDRVGVLEIDWLAARITVQADHPAPGRAHGLCAMPDGGFVALASRPGRWLLRCDAQGRLLQRHELADDRRPQTLGGHALLSADGRHLFTCETHPDSGQGWIGVRSPDSLRLVGEFPSHGLDPHQMVLDDAGRLWVANGGIPRGPNGRKTDLARMAPSLVQLSPADGRLRAEHRLDDPRLSLRHLAWAGRDRARLGIALQAEHDDERQRHAAPLLAVLEDGRLVLPARDAQDLGYAGDIAAGPAGGFVVSGQKSGRGLWWHPGEAGRLTPVAELGEPCALASWDQGRGVLLAARRGAARWHVSDPPRMLPWPRAMAPDNHWLLLDPRA